MKIIDFHVHIGKGVHRSLDPKQLLKLMDRHHIEKCVVCPVDEYIAVKNNEGNEYIGRLVGQYRERLYGMAVANPWRGKESVDELKRTLDKGLIGLKINSILQGFMLCDSIIDPLLQVASSRNVPVYAHTGTMGNALPFQLLELAERFKKVNFIMGHTAYSDFWYDVIPVMERAENIYAETSHVSPAVIRSLVDKCGVQRIIFGSDIPESKLDVEIGKLKLLGLNKKQSECLFALNAGRLLEQKK